MSTVQQRMQSLIREVIYHSATLFGRRLGTKGGNSIGMDVGRDVLSSWTSRSIVKLEALPLSVVVSSRAR